MHWHAFSEVDLIMKEVQLLQFLLGLSTFGVQGYGYVEKELHLRSPKISYHTFGKLCDVTSHEGVNEMDVLFLRRAFS